MRIGNEGPSRARLTGLPGEPGAVSDDGVFAVWKL